MSGPGDQVSASEGRSHGDLAPPHADRERVVGTLKAVFVQGRLAKEEFDLRLGQAFASRTYAELVTLTSFFYVILLLLIGTPILADWLNERW
jgi:hypothetical protein